MSGLAKTSPYLCSWKMVVSLTLTLNVMITLSLCTEGLKGHAFFILIRISNSNIRISFRNSDASIWLQAADITVHVHAWPCKWINTYLASRILQDYCLYYLHTMLFSVFHISHNVLKEIICIMYIFNCWNKSLPKISFVTFSDYCPEMFVRFVQDYSSTRTMRRPTVCSDLSIYFM